MLFALAGLWYLLAIVCAIAGLVFFIMVLIQMFKRDQTNLGIICIVLTFCTGIGPIIAFIYGWIKATEWDIKKIMTYWTVVFVLQFVFGGLAAVSAIGAAATTIQQDMEFDPNNMEFEFDIDETDFEIPEFEMPDETEMLDDSTFDDSATEDFPEPAETP